jgi:protein arginine kinase
MFSPDTTEIIPAWFSVSDKGPDCVISTRIRLARNLADHQFPSRASLLERKNVFEKVTGVIREISFFEGFRCLNFSGTEKIDQQFLLENRIVSKELLNIEGDRGVIFNDAGSISVMVNEEDHLRIQAMIGGCQTDRLWKDISGIDDIVGTKVTYAFGGQHGFLTACPTNSGTGMRVSFLLHLPGLVLTKSIDAVLNGATQMGIAVRGFFGENSDVIGNMFQLSNQACLGASEKEFLEHTTDLIQKIALHEQEARDRLLSEAKNELADKVFRAYGILRYSRSLSVEECVNLSSALRLGIETGILSGMGILSLNRLIMISLPAHIELYHGKGRISDDEKGMLRAALVKKFLPVV